MAKFTEYIANWFRAKESDENQYYDDETVETNPIHTSTTVSSTENPTVVAEAKPAVTQYPAPQPNQEARELPRVEVTIPYWLEDEDMLRDEGVLFGL